jgi:hypothetical protein
MTGKLIWCQKSFHCQGSLASSRRDQRWGARKIVDEQKAKM